MTLREPLTADRIIEAAVAVADQGDLVAVSMRNVGKALGVEAMSLYHHVANKDALLDSLADWIFTQIELPTPADPWRPAILAHAQSMRAVLRRHPWALQLIESRTPGPALLKHHNTVAACFRLNGFSVELGSQAFSVIDAYVYGFALTERNIPLSEEVSAEQFVATIELPFDDYPYLAEVMRERVTAQGYQFADEFEVGLGFILDGLADRLEAAI